MSHDTIYQNKSDRELLDLACGTPPDHEAANYLIFSKYHTLLVGIYMKIFKDEQKEWFEDCAADLRVKLVGRKSDWRNLKQIKGRDNIKSWLEKVAFNFFVKNYKSRMHSGAIEVSIDQEDDEKPTIQIPVDVVSIYDKREAKAIVYEAMAKELNEVERFCLLRRAEGLSYDEIADELRAYTQEHGIKIESSKKDQEYAEIDGTYVGVHVSRARAKVKKYFLKEKNINYNNF